jgi:hypothetical protein
VALETIAEARQHSDRKGDKTPEWDLAELRVQLVEGDVERAETILKSLETNFNDNEGVVAAVNGLLYQYEYSMDDMPIDFDEDPDADPAKSAHEEPRIWTPGSNVPQAGKKAVIWTPS